MYLSPIWVHESPDRAWPLAWHHVLQTASGRPGQGDTYTGSGDMAGKTFMCVNILNSQFHIETSDTW
jgi:hypothetical protein